MMHDVMRKVTLAALVALPMMVASTGCDKIDEVKDGLCCTDFAPGTNMADVDWGLEGSAEVQFSAFMQAAGDFSASASVLVSDLSVVCQELAVDLGAEDNQITETDPGRRAEAWCNEAAARVEAAVKAAGSITISAQPPVCTVSASASANCQAECSGKAECQLEKGELPKCEGDVELRFTCEGKCTGKCSGSAELAVNCAAKCEGTCEGTCSGTCSSKDAAGNCVGSCDGECTGKCRGSCEVKAGASVECEGECSGSCEGTAKAPKCTGGKMPQAKCEVDAQCKGSCDASVQAKAECQPGSIKVNATGQISAKTVAALEASLPRIRALLEGRAQLLAGNVQSVISLAGSVSGSVTASAKATGCLTTAVVPALTDASAALSSSVKASGKLSASIGQ